MGLAVSLRVASWLMGTFSHDEFSALLRVAATDSWSSFWAKAVLVDAHPAGVQAFLTGWVALGDQIGIAHSGTAELWVKWPFLAVSIFGLAGFVLMVRRLAGREAAWLALAVWGGLEWGVLQSGIARPYAPGLAAVFWVGALLVAPEGRGRWVKLGVALAAAGYAHHFAALEAVLLVGAAWGWGRREDRAVVVRAVGLAAVLYGPHVPVLVHQWGHGGLGTFLAPPTLGFVSSYLSLLMNDSVALWGVLLGPAMGAALGVRSGRVWRAVGLGAGLFFVPLGLAFAYSVWRAPILMDRTVYFAAPFFVAGLAVAAMAGWQRWTSWKPVGLVGLVGGIAVVTLFTHRHHHMTAWTSPYEAVFLAGMAHPEAQTHWNGPQHAWDFVGAKTGWDASGLRVAELADLAWSAADTLVGQIAIARAANHRYLTPDADALLWCQRPLLEQVSAYNGDYRRYGAVRVTLPAGLKSAPRPASDAEFGPTLGASLPELMQASGHADAPATPCREVYAGLELTEPLPPDAELVLKCTLGEGQIFYRSTQPLTDSSRWVAVGVRFADLGLSLEESSRVRVSAYLWNPGRQRIETGPLVLGGALGNRFQYAWSQAIPAP